jgi:hypothetical protein
MIIVIVEIVVVGKCAPLMAVQMETYAPGAPIGALSQGLNRRAVPSPPQQSSTGTASRGMTRCPLLPSGAGTVRQDVGVSAERGGGAGLAQRALCIAAVERLQHSRGQGEAHGPGGEGQGGD